MTPSSPQTYPTIFAAVCCLLLSVAAAKAQNTETVCGETYDSVESAMEIIRNRDDVEFNGSNTEYVAFASESEQKIWTFTTNNSHAHPALVCRQVVYVDDTVSIRTTTLCEAEQADCEWLLGQFQALNEDVRKQMQEDREKAQNE